MIAAAASADRPGLLAPDTSGMNFYRADPALTDLLRLHLPEPLFRHIEPHLDRLGGLAGGHLDECARLADRHTPVLHQRDRFGRDSQYDRISSGLSRTGEGRLRRVRHSRDVDPQGHSGLAGQISCRRQARLYVPVQSGRVRPGLSDQRHRWLRQAPEQFRQRGAEGAISRRPDADRHEQADPGRPVHDRKGRRLRRRHADHDGRAGRRSLAAALARNGSAPMPTPKW